MNFRENHEYKMFACLVFSDLFARIKSANFGQIVPVNQKMFCSSIAVKCS